MKKKISSFEDIENNLKILDLRREIALEEMKIAKNSIIHDLNPAQVLKPDVIKSASRLGVIYAIKKVLNI